MLVMVTSLLGWRKMVLSPPDRRVVTCAYHAYRRPFPTEMNLYDR
jgi:hypothetical protein